MIRIFVSKGFSDAEDIADEVIDRVANRLPEMGETYVGEPARYFHGVARYPILERGRRRESTTEVIPDRRPDLERRSDEYECLEKCLKFLTNDKQELILDYYRHQGHEKIELHRVMAEELGITESALRQRAFQVRSKLEKCISNCLPTVDKTKHASRSIHNGVLL